MTNSQPPHPDDPYNLREKSSSTAGEDALEIPRRTQEEREELERIQREANKDDGSEAL